MWPGLGLNFHLGESMFCLLGEEVLPLYLRLIGQQSIKLGEEEAKMVPFPFPPLDSWIHESWIEENSTIVDADSEHT